MTSIKAPSPWTVSSGPIYMSFGPTCIPLCKHLHKLCVLRLRMCMYDVTQGCIAMDGELWHQVKADVQDVEIFCALGLLMRMCDVFPGSITIDGEPWGRVCRELHLYHVHVSAQRVWWQLMWARLRVCAEGLSGLAALQMQGLF